MREADTLRSLIDRIIKRQASILGHVLRREKLENLVKTGRSEDAQQGKTARKKIMLDGRT